MGEAKIEEITKTSKKKKKTKQNLQPSSQKQDRSSSSKTKSKTTKTKNKSNSIYQRCCNFCSSNCNWVRPLAVGTVMLCTCFITIKLHKNLILDIKINPKGVDFNTAFWNPIMSEITTATKSSSSSSSITTAATTTTITTTTTNNQANYQANNNIKYNLNDNVQSKAKSTNENEKQNTAIPNKGDKPMNIILLYADDMRHDSIGIAGTQPVHTPFLDRLSTEGIRFTHNCVTTSICWISRATLHTGEYLSKHESKFARDPIFYKMWNTSFPHLLREKGGYHVGHVGKWNFHNPAEVTGTYHYWQHYEGYHWYPDQNNPGQQIHTTKRSENDALEFLKQRPKDKPFHLTVAFFTPHCVDGAKEQYFPQPQSMRLYNNMTLTPGFDMEASWKRMPPFFDESNQGRIRYHWRFDNPTKYDTMLKNYYRLITEIDETSEKIYNAIKEQGELDNTLFIYTADNGLFHGEHGIAGKWYPHEESIRVPLIIRDPRMPYPLRGTTDDSFTLNIDLYQTLLGAAKVPIPISKQQRTLGRDIADIYLKKGTDSNNNKPWRKEFYYEHPNLFGPKNIPESTALVRKGYKYIRWPQKIFDMTQLFDLTNDPREENDIAKDPKYRNVLNEMKSSHDTLEQIIRKEPIAIL